MDGSGGTGERRTTRTAAAAGPAGWGFLLPNRWELVRLLAVGGQAEVWLARDREVGELVAVKIFHPLVSPAALERLRREVRLGRTLQHPGLVRIYELVEAGGRLALAMEWLPSGSMAVRLERGTPLPIDEVVGVAEQVLAALEHLHGRGIVHRDIKPSNLLLDERGRVKVGDLGLVKVAGGKHLTRTAMTVGSPGYMSPEQICGRELTAASDLYSLGVTLFQLLTGRLPFEGSSDFELAHQHVEAPPPDPRAARPQCPRWLALFVMRLLEKRPGDRWPDAGAALVALKRHSSRPSPRYWRRIALRAGLAAAAAGAIVLAVSGVLHARAAGGAADVVARDRNVVGLDARGRTVWSFACDSPVQGVKRVSLFGDGATQVVASAFPKTASFERQESPEPSEVVILDLDGHLVSDFHPESAAAQIEVFPIAPPELVPSARAFDLLGDGRREIVANCHHRVLGTAYVFVYWPAVRRWEPLLFHPGGWVFDIESVPGTGEPRLRFLAFNGLLASLPVAAELTVTPPGRRGKLEFPDANLLGVPGVFIPNSTGLPWYTLLEQEPPGSFDTPPGFVMEPDGSSLLSVFGKACTLDPWGNPSTGPNVGRDLAALRVSILRRLADHAATAATRTPDAVRREEHEILTDATPLLAERPYRAVAAIYLARARAQIGDLPGGIRLLREAWQQTGNDSVGLNLGHLQAIAGDLQGAWETLVRNRADAVTPAGTFRTTQLESRVAIERHDEAGLAKTMLDWPADERSGPRGVVRARADLWWDEVRPEDCAVHSFDTTPDGEAIACLARWRRGQIRPLDPEAMARAEARNPDAAMECKLARAMALLALGRTADAVKVSADAVTSLETTSSYDFMLSQLLGLARALHARALLAAGRSQDAIREASALHASLRPGLLPALVIDDVLREAQPSSARH